MRKVGEMMFAVYAAPRYLERHGRPRLGTGALGHRVIRVQDDLLGTPDDQWFAERTTATDTAILANSRELQLHAVRAGLGLAHLPCYIAADAPELVRREAGLPVTRELWLGVRQDIRHASRIVAVQDVIVSALSHSRSTLMPDAH